MAWILLLNAIDLLIRQTLPMVLLAILLDFRDSVADFGICHLKPVSITLAMR